MTKTAVGHREQIARHLLAAARLYRDLAKLETNPYFEVKADWLTMEAGRMDPFHTRPLSPAAAEHEEGDDTER